MSNPMYHKQSSTPDSPKTITLSSQDRRAAARLLALLAGYDDVANDTRDETALIARDVMVRRARYTFFNRRRRTQIFGPSLFGEPAWDMLLSLYITDQSAPRNTIGRLVAFSGVSMTTALRWLEVLEKHEFVVRKPHPTDKRSGIISLSEIGRTALDAYFSGTLAEEM